SIRQRHATIYKRPSGSSRVCRRSTTCTLRSTRRAAGRRRDWTQRAALADLKLAVGEFESPRTEVPARPCMITRAIVYPLSWRLVASVLLAISRGSLLLLLGLELLSRNMLAPLPL